MTDLSDKLIETDPNEVKDPNGKYMYKVVTVHDPPFVFVKKSDQADHNHFYGFTIDLLRKLAKELKFTYHLYEVPDGKYGALEKYSNASSEDDGEWNGLIRELIDGKADIAVSAMTVTPKREKYVDFTHRYFDYSVALAMRSPKVNKDMFAFLRPFSNDVWISILCAFIIISILLYFTNRMHLKKNTSRRSQLANRFNDSSLLGTIWFVYSAIVQQSSDMMLVTLSAQIITGVWWFFILIVISSYTATLAAYLTVENLKKPINSFSELARSELKDNFTYGTVRSTSFYDYLEEQASSNPQSNFGLMFKMVEQHSVANANEGYSRVINDSYNYGNCSYF